MKTLFTFLLSAMILLLTHTQAEACDLDPTAVIDILPDEVVFLVGDSIYMEAYNSSPNCGYISGYRWRVEGVTQSTSGYFIPNLTLQSTEDSRSFDIQLRVQNSVGNYGYKTVTITIVREHSSYYYLTDHLGSVRVTVDEQGNSIGWDDYYPFGLQMPGRTQNNSNPDDDQKFTGYELEQQGDLGLYHAGARMYDPVIGRFNSQDRFKEKYPSKSPYQYAALNPISFIDVNGDSIWVAPNEDGNGFTIHYEGKLYNQSGKNIDMEKASSEISQQIQESFSGILADGSSINTVVNLTAAESMDEVSDSDHLIVIDKVKSGTNGEGRGSTDNYGQKISYVDSGDFYHLYNPFSLIFSNNVRTTAHEVGHQMGLAEQPFKFKQLLMAQGRSGTTVSTHSLLQIERHFKNGFLNQGTNRAINGPYPPFWRR